MDNYDMGEAVKIWKLPVDARFRPHKQNFTSPPHNDPTYGIEDDFEHWLDRQPYLIANTPQEADWDYLSIRWNKLYINWNWGQSGLDEIQSEILRLVSRNHPTFTICEYDVQTMQPFFDLCGMTVFTGSRKAENEAIDIPVLCSPHQHAVPGYAPKKRWLASFVGNVNTAGVRVQMQEALKGRGDVYVENNQRPIDFFVNLILESYLALCPRGYGGQTMRFYEAMQLGVTPLLIGDMDTRPFKEWINWDAISLYCSDAIGLSEYLDGLDSGELIEMGQRAATTFHDKLAYGQWPQFVIRHLEDLQNG